MTGGPAGLPWPMRSTGSTLLEPSHRWRTSASARVSKSHQALAESVTHSCIVDEQRALLRDPLSNHGDESRVSRRRTPALPRLGVRLLVPPGCRIGADGRISQTTDAYVGRKIISRNAADVLDALGGLKNGSLTEPRSGAADHRCCDLWKWWAAWGSQPEPKDS